ncbi:hypothetical protein BLNAU_6561 [Blattamonas nauphoetae]|uniref:Transmembrane protein n=1 Tax=Blattamonas nauphoetae TaxID=2049346 RepID=A0ABQ9Y454_9EUKA|nr:hypothetical protein BLNAU_6561 [Blattamonas nauphoetae]
MNSLRRHLVSISLHKCPSDIYGQGGWVQLIDVVLLGIAALISITELISIVSKKGSNFFSAQAIFLHMIFWFSVLQLLNLLVPIPWTNLTYLLIADQLPRYFVFLAFQFLAIWLGSAVFSSFAKNRSTKNWISILIIVILTLLLIASVILSVFGAASPTDSSLMNKNLSIVNMVGLLTIIVSILIYFIRLYHIYCQLTLDATFKRRIVSLLVVVSVTLIIFSLRLIYNLFVFLGRNSITKMYEQFLDKIIDNPKDSTGKYVQYYLLVFVFQLIFNISPVYLLFSEYFILSLQSKNQKKKKRMEAQIGYSIKRTRKRNRRKHIDESDNSSSDSATSSRGSNGDRNQLFPKRQISRNALPHEHTPINTGAQLYDGQSPYHYSGEENHATEKPHYSPDFSINDD